MKGSKAKKDAWHWGESTGMLARVHGEQLRDKAQHQTLDAQRPPSLCHLFRPGPRQQVCCWPNVQPCCFLKVKGKPIRFLLDSKHPERLEKETALCVWVQC